MFRLHNQTFAFCMWIAFVLMSLMFQKTFTLQWNLGGDWTVCNLNSSICINATVPGCVHRDLQLSGRVPDFTHGFETDKQRWIAENDWTYVKQLSLPKSVLYRQSKFLLVFDGLDTVADIFWNGQHVGESRSMFVDYRFNVTKWIKTQNELKVVFHSAVVEANRLTTIYPYPVPPVANPTVERGYSHPQFLRKEQSSFGWDWGPAAASMGIYRPVKLVAIDHFHITSIAVQVRLVSADQWEVKVKIIASVNHPSFQTKLCLRMIIERLQRAHRLCHHLIPINQTELEIQQSMTVSNAEYWWPTGMGAQNLYDLDITVTDGNKLTEQRVVKRIGFRTVELVQEKGSYSKGLSFYFRINGRKLFLKGSNWIPARVCPANVTAETTRHLLQSARDAHMNVLRVWGGGVYETDEFYDLADELGILLWQDAMFACAMYPTDDAFLALVESELRYQVRRLSSYPSVFVYAGNNENEKALRQNWYGTGGNFSLYYRDYVQLYVKTVRRVILEEDKTRPFVTSSPSNGVLSEQEGWVAKNPNDPLYGDLHSYRYVEDGWDYRSYPVGRFISEYGIQSLPSFDSLLFAADGNLTLLDLKSEWMKHRQHHPRGYEQLISEVLRHFVYPVNGIKSKVDHFKGFIYLTQLNQAMSIKTASEFFRVSQSSNYPDGRGNTMGAMFWQLNDVWTAPTWSSIEYSGKWKMLHYFAQNFFAPLLVTSLKRGDIVTIYGVSDYMGDLENLRLNVTMRNPMTFEAVSVESKLIKKLPSQSSVELANVTMKDKCHNCYWTFDLALSDVIFSQNFFPPPTSLATPLSNVRIGDIQPNDSSSGYWVFRILLIASDPAFFVWLDNSVHDGVFDRNGFHMYDTRIVVFFTCRSSSILIGQFNVNHLALTIY